MATLIRYSRVCLVLALLAAFGAARADERPEPKGGFKPPSDFADKAAEYMSARARLTGFSGTVLVAHDGRPLFREGYGLASREFDVPNTPATKFPVASVTKQFTAAAVLL